MQGFDVAGAGPLLAQRLEEFLAVKYGIVPD
jgi:hypothetical protein